MVKLAILMLLMMLFIVIFGVDFGGAGQAVLDAFLC